MDSITLVNKLHEYFLLLSALELNEHTHFKGKDESVSVEKSVSLRYTTITADLSFEGEAFSKNITLKFAIDDQTISLNDLYCEHAERQDIVRAFVLEHAPAGSLTDNRSPHFRNEETQHYLTIADEIAKQAHHFSAGDDYRPGYYSEIALNDNGIVLKQINHWNARSIDHKKDYTLRNLEFYISLTEDKPKLSFQQEYIGKMIVLFSDSSSEHNKKSGNRILEKIKEERQKIEPVP
jgi:hypothetical protein